MLHITNGESVQVAEAVPGGEFVYWADVLHEGPVPRLPLDELAPVRAGFIAQACGEPEAKIRAGFERRYFALKGFRDHDELVLWFEHDLYDQLQLIQILDYLAREPFATTRVSLIQAGTYLGAMTPHQLADLFPLRRDVTRAQLDTARRAWNAFCSTEPGDWEALARSDTSSLPYLRAAMVRHLEQFPAARDGLNRTQRQILESVGAGAKTIGAAFLASREEPQFMGDTTFARYVRELGTCTQPLLEVPKHRRVMETPLKLTATGREVLDGSLDHIHLNGIDRWLGGVRLLSTGRIWRWDGYRLVQ